MLTASSVSRSGIITSNAIAFMRSGRLSVISATCGRGLSTRTKDMRAVWHPPCCSEGRPIVEAVVTLGPAPIVERVQQPGTRARRQALFRDAAEVGDRRANVVEVLTAMRA